MPGDWCRAGIGLECTGVGESGAVIADSASTRAPVESASPGDDLVVGMGPEQFGGRLAKLVDIRACRVECGEQGQSMLGHRFFDLNWLTQLGFA